MGPLDCELLSVTSVRVKILFSTQLFMLQKYCCIGQKTTKLISINFEYTVNNAFSKIKIFGPKTEFSEFRSW